MGCQACTDDPWLNLSSEDPDRDRKLGIKHFTKRPPLGWVYEETGCDRICVSEVSQEEADDCALAQAQACLFEHWEPHGRDEGPFQPPAIYTNRTISCTIRCSDGATVSGGGENTFTWTVPVGSVVALSQQQADSLAGSLACQRARIHRICISDRMTGGCVNQAYKQRVVATGGTPAIFPYIGFTVPAGCAADVAAGDRTAFSPIRYTFSLIGGALPPGLELRPCTGYIKGTPTTGGAYVFTVRATDAIGSFQNRTITLSIIEITTEEELPDAVLGEEYLEPLIQNGGDPLTEQWTIINGELPPGLTLSPAGLISGTPTGDLVGYQFTAQAVVSGATCQKQFTLEVTTGLPEPIEYWDFEENNISRVGQVLGIELVQQFAVLVPAGLGKIANAAKLTNSAFPYTSLSTDSPFEKTELRNRGTGFTVAGWANLTDALQWPVAINFWNPALVSQGSFIIDINGGANRVRITGTDAASVGFTVTQAEAIGPTSGTWFFFRAWFDPSDNKMKLQINNGLISVSATALSFPASDSGSLFIAPDFSFNPGLEMMVDEMGIWMPHLSDTQAEELYNSGAGKTCCPFS